MPLSYFSDLLAAIETTGHLAYVLVAILHLLIALRMCCMLVAIAIVKNLRPEVSS